MADEHIDPIYEYIDEKLKLVRRDLGKELLKTQRFLANLQIRVIHDESLDMVKNKAVSPQFVSEVSIAVSKVNTSEDPLSIANKFTKKRWEDLEKLGVEVLRVHH